MALLKDVPLARLWPVVGADVLAYVELRQDAMYPFIKTNQIAAYIDGALEYGKQAARRYHYDGDLAPLIDQVLKSGARVSFVDERKRKGDRLIRAQYEKRGGLIAIFRPSIEQMAHFFQRSGYRVRLEDLVALHLCHEWFHHLEETRIGRTDRQLPKITMRKVGPVSFKQSVEKTREIAAHAFTQQVMDLSWYPLLLDCLIRENERKAKKERIRETLYQYRQEFAKAVEKQRTVV